MVLIVFCHNANSAAVLTVKGKYMKSSVVILYYRHAHALSSAFSAFLIKATQISPLMESVLIRLYGFKQATICKCIIMYSETNTNKASEIKYNRYVHVVVMTLQNVWKWIYCCVCSLHLIISRATWFGGNVYGASHIIPILNGCSSTSAFSFHKLWPQCRHTGRCWTSICSVNEVAMWRHY